MKIAFLCTFIGEKGGIPILEKVLLKYLEPKKYFIVSYVPINYDGSKKIISRSPLKSIIELNKYIKQEKIDLIIYQFHTFPLFLQKKPYIIKIHDTNLFSLKYLKESILTILNCIWAKKIVVVSRSTEKELKKIFRRLFLNNLSNKIVQIYNPYNPYFLEYIQLYDAQPEKYSKILNKYNLEKDKYFLIMDSQNIDFLINGIINVLKKFDTNNKIVIVGNISKKKINKLKKKYTNLIFTGYVNHKDLIVLYRNALTIIYNNMNEGFGYVPLEALLCETPIITNPDKSISEVAGKYGFYYTDQKSYELQIEKILLKKHLLRKNLSEGKNYALKKFSPEKFVKQTLEITEEI